MAITAFEQIDFNYNWLNTQNATEELLKLANEVVAVNLGCNTITASLYEKTVTIESGGMWEWGGVLFKLNTAKQINLSTVPSKEKIVLMRIHS
jgi:hypothetical protein